MYGLAKTKADAFDVNASSYKVFAKPDSTSPSQRVLAASWEGVGEKKPASAFPKFAPLAEGLALPLVGHSPIGFECSNFNWGVDHMRLTAATGSMEVDASFVGSIQSRKVPFVGIDQEYFSGFLMETAWTMSAPYPCSVLHNLTLV